MASHFCRSFFSLANSNSVRLLGPSKSFDKFLANKNLVRSYVDRNDTTNSEVKSEPLSEQINAKLGDSEVPSSEDEKPQNKPQKSLFQDHAIPIKNGLLGWQPTVETHSKYIMKEDGVPYEKLHIVSIKASANNTIMTLSDHTGGVLFSTSAGCNGFKNAKKGTAVAAQATALILGDNLKRRGIQNIRVQVKGFGNGRLPSIKALQMNKLNVISISDTTPVPMAFARTPRPPAKRRI